MKPNIKKLLILNAPYLLFVYLFDKVGQAVRLSPGADLSGKPPFQMPCRVLPLWICLSALSGLSLSGLRSM